jgi:uncharacterized LabA/DUF88 family protein
MNKERILIQFDGSNFYNKVKRLDHDIHLSNFNYKKLCKSITKQTSFEAIYYVGEIKYSPNSQQALKLYKGQQSLLYTLQTQNIQIKLGYLLYNNGRFQEKGVDVQIAVDLVDKAANDEYDICYLISSDTDLIPAIKAAQKRGKKVVYVAFEKQISFALERICDSTLLINETYFNIN